MYNGFFAVIVALLVLDFVWGQVLAALNRSRMSPDIPAGLEGMYEPDAYAKQQKYQKANSSFGRLYAWLSFVIMLVVLGFGVLGWLDGALAAVTDNFILLPLLFFGVIIVVNSVSGLPFDWYDTFVIEERFGFNKSTVGVFVKDFFVSLAMTTVIGGVLLGAVAAIYHFTGASFWIWAWAVVFGISLFINFFYSELIVPLFNKQTPLEEGELREAIMAFAARAGFHVDNIFVMDGSKRSSKANAYFAGFGPKKRIVLYDTLMDQLDTGEIVAVLAHEIGHYQKKHIRTSLLISGVTTGVQMWLMGLFLGNAALAAALGGATVTFELGMVGFGLIFTPVSTVLNMAQNALSRAHEYQADAYAASFGQGEALISALKKISTEALTNLNPHPLVVATGYSHPTLLQRMQRIREDEGA
jgi:STE24 endopeptidase